MLTFYLSEIDKECGKQKFERIYLQYRETMFIIANEILKNKENAEDAVQDAFVLIIRNLDNIDDVLSKKTANYIKVIIKNRSLQIYNRNKKREILTDDYNFFASLPDPVQNVEERLVQTEMVNMVEEMILALPDRYKEVLYLYYYNELPYSKIAEALNTTEANARQIARRARKLLEDRLIEKTCPEKEISERRRQHE